jgi:hypothetical protein
MKTQGSVALLVFSLVTSSPAWAFSLLYSASQNLNVSGWATDTVTFDIDTSCSSNLQTVESALSIAQDVWNGVPSAHLTVATGKTTSLPNAITHYISGGTVQNAAPSGNPVVYCDTSFQTNTGASASNIPGLATAQLIQTTTGKIYGGLLILNFQSGAAANVATLGAESASYVLAHEIGHILGLGHSSSNAALMYYTAPTGKEVRLAQDDIDGISYLYPRQEPGNGGLMGCGTLSLLSGSAHSGSGPQGGRSRPKSGLGGPAEFILLAVVVYGFSHRRRTSAAH